MEIDKKRMNITIAIYLILGKNSKKILFLKEDYSY